MKIEIMIPSLIAVVMIFSILCCVGRSNYLEYTKEKFDFRSHFPYEMQDNQHFKYNWQVRFLSLFFALAHSLFAVNAFDMSNASSLSFVIGVMILNAIVMMLVFIVPMRKASLHMALAIIQFGLTFLSYALVSNYVFFFNTQGYPLFLGIASSVIGVGILLSLINPKLYRWMYLDKVEENGEIVLKRPKVMMLALYEWIFMFLTILLDLLVVIATFIMLNSLK
ncbi:MAG: hypothetical protein J1F31_04005 [Erysipelotrichales bacterium]|nr:hypothetical protein [Erysipelotrichales bacterium]